MMHTPMRFTFSKDVVDERAIMTQGAEPVHHRMVVDTPAKQIVSMDVDFADASGKVYKSTYFEFDLQRAKGYFEAGEYTVGLSGQDGDVGGAQKITLKGDNPPVYRGSMDFTGKEAKQKGPKIQKVEQRNGQPARGAPGGQRHPRRPPLRCRRTSPRSATRRAWFRGAPSTRPRRKRPCRTTRRVAAASQQASSKAPRGAPRRSSGSAWRSFVAGGSSAP